MSNPSNATNSLRQPCRFVIMPTTSSLARAICRQMTSHPCTRRNSIPAPWVSINYGDDFFMRPGPHKNVQLPSRFFMWFSFIIIVTVALAGADWLGMGRPFAHTVSAGVQPARAALAGDTCAMATAISPGALPFSTEGTTDGAANDIDPGLLGCAAGAGPDVVFSFTPAATDRYTIGATPTGSGFDLSLYVVTDCANPATTCVAGANTIGTSRGEFVTPTLNAGTQYFIVVDGSSPGNFGSFHFSLRRGLPPNDTCASPTVIEASRLPFTASATTFGAGNDLNADVPCLRSRQSGSGAVDSGAGE